MWLQSISLMAALHSMEKLVCMSFQGMKVLLDSCRGTDGKPDVTR